MYTTITTIHYKRHLIVKKEAGKYFWRGQEFDTQEHAFKAIDDKISLYNLKTKNMEQNKFEWTEDLIKEFAKGYNNEALIKSVNGIDYYLEKFKASKTKPKEYEILEFSVDYLGDSNVVFYKSTEPNIYRKKGTDMVEWCDISNAQKAKSFQIKSVRRLGDGEVFSIGDEVLVGVRKGKIGKFISAERLQIVCVDCEPCYNLYQLEKAKQPILTTQDGKDIYEGELYHAVQKRTFDLLPCFLKLKDSNDWVTFSTKEAAEQYILLNKPCLSVNESLKAYPAPIDSPLYNELKQNLIELAKSKTK